MGDEVQEVRGAGRRQRAEDELPWVRKARAEVAAYAECTESQMMAVFGWTDPDAGPLHRAGQPREAPHQRMEKVVVFDRGRSLDGAAGDEQDRNGKWEQCGHIPGNFRKKSREIKPKRGFVVRSEGGVAPRWNYMVLFHALEVLLGRTARADHCQHPQRCRRPAENSCG
jgi:hypothetical protein